METMAVMKVHDEEDEKKEDPGDGLDYGHKGDKLLGTQTGVDHIKNALEYNGIVTPIENRVSLGLQGLMPAGHLTLDAEVERCMSQLRAMEKNTLQQYQYLANLKTVSEHTYFAMLTKYTAEIMPIVYTPTVGLACQEFSRTVYTGGLQGLFLSIKDAGKIRSILDNWPHQNVTTIVVTDGERILGLGDLGVNGMGIPIGKLALYTACAGIPPSQVLPVHIDVGTNNEANLQDPYYLGLKQHRVRGAAYDSLIKEFMEAAMDKFGRHVLIQFEDFGNINAFRLLEAWKDNACTFNDDIQGTASVALGGMLASERLIGKNLSEHTFLFSGAGEAGTGIAQLIAYAIALETSVTLEEARKRIYLVDSKGLVTHNRLSNLQPHKVPFAHKVDKECQTLKEAVEFLKPTALIGVSAIPKSFDHDICEMMADFNERPLIFALSNPTSQAECTAREAYLWTEGRAVFASGSPFDPVTLEEEKHSSGLGALFARSKPVEFKYGRSFVPGQGNNAYIFPGIGLGQMVAGSTRITTHDFYLAAKTLSDQVTEEELQSGSLYPNLDHIRDVSAAIAVTIAQNAHDTGVATNDTTPTLDHVINLMYNPWDNQPTEEGKL